MTSAARSPRQRLAAPHEIARHVADLTVTVSADVTLAALQASLAEVGQWAAVDGPGEMPIGRLIEIDSTGPLRLGYGAWRDLLLGVQFINGRGELITAGGRTVKNVAGYDLTKFMVGSCRVFGEIVTATMRTYRKPAGAIVARFAPDPSIVAKLLTTPMRPQWALLRADRLLLGYLGDEPTLQFVDRQLPALEPVEKSTIGEIETVRAAEWPIEAGGMLVRAALPPAKLAGWTAGIGARSTAKPSLSFSPSPSQGEGRGEGRAGPKFQAVLGQQTPLDPHPSPPPERGREQEPHSLEWSADPVFGVVIVGNVPEADVEALAASAEAAGGTVRVFADIGTVPRLVRVSTNAGERKIIEQLKQALDPDHRLQPLCF